MAAQSGKKKRSLNEISESSQKSRQLTGKILSSLPTSLSATDGSLAVVGDIFLHKFSSRLLVQLQLSMSDFQQDSASLSLRSGSASPAYVFKSLEKTRFRIPSRSYFMSSILALQGILSFSTFSQLPYWGLLQLSEHYSLALLTR